MIVVFIEEYIKLKKDFIYKKNDVDDMFFFIIIIIMLIKSFVLIPVEYILKLIYLPIKSYIDKINDSNMY